MLHYIINIISMFEDDGKVHERKGSYGINGSKHACSCPFDQSFVHLLFIGIVEVFVYFFLCVFEMLYFLELVSFLFGEFVVRFTL